MKVETLTDCRIYVGDVLDSLRAMPADSVHCCVTSPPYWALRDYGVEGQIGLEPTIGEYVAKMVEVFREVRRVLHPSGVCWVNLGDTYAGSGRGGNPIGSPHQKQSTNAGSIIGETARVAANTRHAGQERCGEITAKNLCGIPWRVYLAMQDDGWYWRDSIAWHKPSPMPESVQDRCTKAWEPIGMFAKSAKYFYDAVAIAEDAKYGDRGSSFTNGKTFEYQGRRSVGRGEFNGKTNALTGREAFRAITQTRNRRNVWTIAPEPFTFEKTYHRERVEAGAFSDGMTHIASSDCPCHGSLHHRESTLFCDEHAAVLSSRIPRSNDHLGQERSDDSSPTAKILSPLIPPHSSDYSLRPCFASATSHSTENHKKVHDLATTSAYTPSSETTFHTERTQVQRELFGLSPDSDESNTSLVDSAASPSPGTKYGNDDTHIAFGTSIDSLREHGCTCVFYRTIAKESTHFATFPSELPRLCIMAGSSEHGCCPACLSPYRRVTDKQKRTRQRPNDYTKRTGADGTGNSCANSVAGVAVTTLGWEPACQCNGGEPIPCTVLDPFMGSGTTGAVAFALHRRFVGCELNPEYVALAKRRIGGVIERTRLLDPIGA